MSIGQPRVLATLIDSLLRSDLARHAYHHLLTKGWVDLLRAASRVISRGGSHEAVVAILKENHVVHLSLLPFAWRDELAVVTVGSGISRPSDVLHISSTLSLVSWLPYHLLATLSLDYIFLN